MLAAVLLCAGLAACSDKDEEPTVPTAKEVAGSYTGNMMCTAMGADMSFDDVDVTITATDDSHVTVIIASFGNPPMQLPQLIIDGVSVSGVNGNYSLANTQFSGTASDGKNYSGTLKGTLASTLELQMNLQYGNMPVPLVCSYSAVRNNVSQK